MKPAPFDYEAPESLAAALDLLARHGGEANLLAGERATHARDFEAFRDLTGHDILGATA